MKTPDIPFRYRKFTLDGEPVDIEDFISANAASFEEATVMRLNLIELLIDYHMYFKFAGSSTEREIYRIS